MTSATRDRIIRAALEGDYLRAPVGVAEFVTARLMHAGADRERFLAGLEAVSDELLAIGLAVAEADGSATAEG